MDPYEVLGVSRDADEETIKKAYKNLVKKYHPDKYINSPMADVASQKMKEINRAYDMITKGETTQNPYQRNTAGYNPFGGFYRQYGTGNTSNAGNTSQPSFQNVRLLIRFNRLAESEQMLNSLPKTAEWYYLYGLICYRKGWYDQAVENIQKAIDMDPNNVEYRSTMEQLRGRSTSYTTSTYRNTNACPCDCCTLCLCLQCLNPSPCC